MHLWVVSEPSPLMDFRRAGDGRFRVRLLHTLVAATGTGPRKAGIVQLRRCASVICVLADLRLAPRVQYAMCSSYSFATVLLFADLSFSTTLVIVIISNYQDCGVLPLTMTLMTHDGFHDDGNQHRNNGEEDDDDSRPSYCRYRMNGVSMTN